jgi:hypothetical protein
MGGFTLSNWLVSIGLSLEANLIEKWQGAHLAVVYFFSTHTMFLLYVPKSRKLPIRIM